MPITTILQGKEILNGKIHPMWIQKHGLDKAVGEIISLPAREMLHHHRFDLFAKSSMSSTTKPIARLSSAIRSDRSFYLYRLKWRLSNINSKTWIKLYNNIRPLWKEKPSQF